MASKSNTKKRAMSYVGNGRKEHTDYHDGSRTVTIAPRLEEILTEQKKVFLKKFGREPGPDDPLFFDPDTDTPRFITEETSDWLIEQLVEAMRNAGVDEEYMHAYRKTGLLITQENMDWITPAELEEFEQAVREYEEVREIVR